MDIRCFFASKNRKEVIDLAVFKVCKNSNYTVMSNYHFKEREMSLKAKGLLSLMLSLPEDWDYSIAGLVAICKENETAIKTALKELQKFGYVEVIKLTPNQTQSGRFEYVYNIYETPKQEGKKQDLENLHLEILHIENQGQLNTNKLNTNKLNKVSKKVNTPKKKEKQTKETFDELIENYTDNEELRTELKEHLKTRKLKKATLTNRAIILSFRTLNKLAQTDDEKILVVQQSIENGWTSFYPLRQTKKKTEESYQGSYDIDAWEKNSDEFLENFGNKRGLVI